MNSIHIIAPAKVNIALDIVGKRADGYHEMRMINHSLNLSDKIIIEKKNSVSIKCTDNRVPLNEKNIVYKAFCLLRDRVKADFGAEIFIDKQIPMEAGLGGGSTDAAAVLKGLNELYQFGLDESELIKIGIRCGADVPYCLVGGTALVQGIGEKIDLLPALHNYEVLVVKPNVNISTAYAFACADQCKGLFHPDIMQAAEKLRKREYNSAVAYYGNSFESVMFKIHPEIESIKQEILQFDPFYATMTGSGSTLVAYFQNREQALKAKLRFKSKMFTYLAGVE